MSIVEKLEKCEDFTLLGRVGVINYLIPKLIRGNSKVIFDCFILKETEIYALSKTDGIFILEKAYNKNNRLIDFGRNVIYTDTSLIEKLLYDGVYENCEELIVFNQNELSNGYRAN